MKPGLSKTEAGLKHLYLYLNLYLNLGIKEGRMLRNKKGRKAHNL